MVGGLAFLIREEGERVVKTRDYVHEYRGNGPEIRGLCGVRLYEEKGKRPVVVLTEPPEDTGYTGPWLTDFVENVVAELVRDLDPLSEAVRRAERSQGEPFVVVGHAPRSRAEIRRGAAETFERVVFASYEPRPVGSAGFWRHSLGEPDWAHLTRAEAEELCGEGLDDPGWLARFRGEVEKRGPKEDAAGLVEARDSARKGRQEEAHDMLPPLTWDPRSGDVVLERVPDFEGGFDLAGNLKHKVRTNVPWSVVEHGPSGFESSERNGVRAGRRGPVRREHQARGRRKH